MVINGNKTKLVTPKRPFTVCKRPKSKYVANTDQFLWSDIMPKYGAKTYLFLWSEFINLSSSSALEDWLTGGKPTCWGPAKEITVVHKIYKIFGDLLLLLVVNV